MKSSKRSEMYRPFENLDSVLDKDSLPSAAPKRQRHAAAVVHDSVSDVEEEERLFQDAMAGVVPIARGDDRVDKARSTAKVPEQDADAEALARLEDLIKCGAEFIISDTPEYMEGTGYGVNPEVAKRLHSGDFSIQAHLNLHELGVDDAHEAFEQFLKDAIMQGKRAVLIIHGRGLSSRAEPVLKNKVKNWLTSGPWHKWVIAFTSARACDGGTGATYVLLRQRPATKRHRKGTAKNWG